MLHIYVVFRWFGVVDELIGRSGPDHVKPVNWGNETTQLPHPRKFFIWLILLFTLLLFTASCHLLLSFCNSFLLLDLILDHPVVWQQTVQSSVFVSFTACYSTCHSTTPRALQRAVLVECFTISAWFSVFCMFT